MMPIVMVLLWIVLAFMFFTIYFIAAWIAKKRNAVHYHWILIANVVAGATGAGWVIVLIWALYDRPRIDPHITAIFPDGWKPRD